MANTDSILRIKSEDDYFKAKEAEQIKKLREKCLHDKKETYCDEHKNHCFRCGTKSLVEIEKGSVAIDICINEGCGAVHLDPGELDAILADKDLIQNTRKSIFNIFK